MPARVPDYNNGTFAVAPTIQPVGAVDSGLSAENATIGAREIMRTGEQIAQAGKQVATIEVDALQQANQLRIDDSLNQLKESSLDLRYNPQSGFENIRGIDALQRPSGKSMTDDYTEMLQKRASDIENGLSNDAQKIAFRRNANNLITSFRGDAEQHEGSQFQGYALSVREGTIKNRMNEIALNYSNPDAVAESVTSIRAAAFDQARLLGKSAEWAEAQARESVSKAHSVAVLTALQNNNPTYADAYMQKHAGEMNADDILHVSGTLTPKLDQQAAQAAVNGVMGDMGPHIVTSNSDRAFNIALGTESNYRQFDKSGKPLTSSAGAVGIAQVMPATAPEAAKLAGLPWDEEKYKNDEGYNRALGKAYFEKQLRDFNGNLAMAYAAYNAGGGRLQEAIDSAKAKGQPEHWVDELPKETQKYVQKNMAAYSAGAGQFAKPSLFELQAAVREKLGTGRPERLKMALDETERQFNAINAATKQRNEEAKANAMRAVIENGGRYTDLSADARGALAPEDVSSVMDFAKRVASGDDTTNLWLYNKLTSNPQDLKSMTDDQFFALHSELSQADFKHFSDERAKMLTGTAPNGPGDLNTDAITRTLNDRLNSMGIDPTPKDESNDAKRVGAIRRFVNQSIAVEQANRGKKMNDVEVSGYIDTLFAQQSVYSGLIFDSKGPTLGMKVGDIPSATRDALKAAFKRNGVENPTDADLLNAYWRQMSMNQKSKTKPNG